MYQDALLHHWRICIRDRFDSAIPNRQRSCVTRERPACCCLVRKCTYRYVPVVDTSANYTGGKSEMMVGHVLNRWRASPEGKDTSVNVVSKFGYTSVRTELSSDLVDLHVQ